MTASYSMRSLMGSLAPNRIPTVADHATMTDGNAQEIAGIVAEAAPLPLRDAAYALWRRRQRTLPERVASNL